jgi:uncharacterized protein YggU (UPF0235/DUF167 family)
MRITILVKTNSSRPGVVPQDDGTFLVRVASTPVEGRANEEVVDNLSRFFHIPKSAIHIAKGARGRRKIIELDT